MGLMDILNGMQNGPRGPSDPTDKSGGMSPMTMAILAMLAYKGYKHLSGNQNPTANAPAPSPQAQPQTTNSGGLGGVLGNIFGGSAGAPSTGGGGGLGGMLGGLLAGGAAGSVLSGGLGDLMKQFQQHGQGDAVNSWVGSGPNKQIAPHDLASALGADQIDQLTARTGLSRDDLLSELSHELPGAVDHFTPDGRVPTDHEMSRWA